MSHSHLYQGFQYAGKLQSIEYQRMVQKNIILTIRPCNILSVGCAQGDEIETILNNESIKTTCCNVTAIDIANVWSELSSKKIVKTIGKRFSWQLMDLLECNNLHDYGQYDVVQCGFVLHDIPYELKNIALYKLSKAVAHRGYLIVSDFFFTYVRNYKEQISTLYDNFIQEAQQAMPIGRLSPLAYHQLVGDGTEAGIYRTRQEAMQGDRDYFDDMNTFMSRVNRLQLKIIGVYQNPLCSFAKVILLQSTCKPIKSYRAVRTSVESHREAISVYQPF